MKRALPAIVHAAAALALWAVLGGVPGRDAAPQAAFVSLLAWQLVATAGLVVSFAGLGRGRFAILGVLAGLGLHTALSALPCALLLPASGLPAALLLQAAFGALVAGGWWLEAAVIARKPGGTLALLVATAALLAPFGLDAWLESSRPMAEAAAAIEHAVALSPPVALCEHGLEWDLFKHEPVYRAFRVGETVYRWPTPAEAARETAIAAALLIGAAAVLTLVRRGISLMGRGAAAAL